MAVRDTGHKGHGELNGLVRAIAVQLQVTDGEVAVAADPIGFGQDWFVPSLLRLVVAPLPSITALDWTVTLADTR